MSSFSKEMIRKRALQKIQDEEDASSDDSGLSVEIVGPEQPIITPENDNGMLSISAQDESGPKSSMQQALARRLPYYTVAADKITKPLPKKK